MIKTCIVCGKQFNDWFMRLLGFVFKDKHEFFTCGKCRQLHSMGYTLDEIEKLEV